LARALAVTAAIAACGVSACSPLGIGLGAGAAAGVVIAQERSAEEAARDATIDVEINNALFQAHIDKLFREVNVDVMEGRVMLTGTVANQDLVDQAARIAWATDGVRQVLNEVRVGDDTAVDSLRDRWITSKLRADMLTDKEIYDVNYAITTVGGSIYILGIAQDQAELNRVKAYARNIEGVRRVVTHVVMKDDPSRPK